MSKTTQWQMVEWFAGAGESDMISMAMVGATAAFPDSSLT
jgi:hypothetical protein